MAPDPVAMGVTEEHATHLRMQAFPAGAVPADFTVAATTYSR